MVACGAEIIVIVPLAVGPPSDEGLVSWQGTPLTGLGGGGEGRDFFFFAHTSLAVEKWGLILVLSFIRYWLTGR